VGICPYCQLTLPEPSSSFCPRCGKPVGAALGVSGTPWERGGAGRVSAFVETSKQILFSPGVFFESMPVSGGMGQPLVYGIVAGFLGAVAGAIYVALVRLTFGSSILALAGEQSRALGAFSILQGGVGFVFTLIFAPVFVIMGIFISAGIYHVVLLLLGAAKEAFEATFRVCCYTQAVSLLAFIPLCGASLRPFWTVAVLTIGFSRAHRIGVGMAFLAVMIPLILVCCCCAGAMGAIVGMAGGLGGFLSRMRFQ
jgi:hypothetical protein